MIHHLAKVNAIFSRFNSVLLFQTQATMAQRINRLTPMGGRFHLGEFNGSKIVEKIFCIYQEEQFKREKSFYESPLTRHKFILGMNSVFLRNDV